ncbi:poly(A) RNA polymerase gld-2 homolog A-like isoform X2 [Ischnura elegans]|uniref:poly(A) RNA polymerase gld-2 homolog A-like isoform X2 n=1 Tax=Ischnura elegans TaxID=197161 RepID=UPI001ED867E2|nr:poly(A) RNA polymerase gld-2 homolog A-like isoform X2 [Ischnura elegans]
MAMHHAILTQHLVQTMGQPQQLQQHHNHHQLATGGVSPRQRTLIRRYHGAMHREQTGHLKSSSEMMRPEGVESATDGSANYLHHSKGNQRGRSSPGPSHRGYHEMHLNPVADGSIAGKSHHDNGSRNGDDKANLDEGPQADGKRVKRQHKFYSKVGNVPGNMSVLGSPCYGAGQCYSPSDARAVAYQQGLHVHKRRFQADSRPFAFHSQRGRKMGGGGVGPMLDAGLSSVLKYPLPVSHVPNAPDRFLSRAHLVNVKGPPTNLCSGGEWDKLSEGIWDKFFSNQQSEETFIKKMLLWKCLYVLIKNTFPRYGLYLVGSTMSGFGSDSSDVDMCLLVRYTEMDQRNEAVGHLEQILHYLKQCDFIDSVELIQAKVPILKFRDSRYGLEVDLNCNNSVGIRNTHLLYCYSQLDWRVRPLVLVVKLWAHKHNINDAKNMTISSYSLTLMVINFLQCGVSPPVLPCLHSMYLGKFSPHLDLHRINLMEEMAPYNSENTMALGELFLGFLRYYSLDFDFTQEAVSVRLAARISIEDCRRVRSYKNDPHQWKFLCIEEPFDLTNTARSVYDKDVFERVKHVFRSSYLKLKDHKTIDCLFED